jgi:hypothetical protein
VSRINPRVSTRPLPCLDSWLKHKFTAYPVT